MRADCRAWSLQKGNRVEWFEGRKKGLGTVTKVLKQYELFEIRTDAGEFVEMHRNQLRRANPSKRVNPTPTRYSLLR